MAVALRLALAFAEDGIRHKSGRPSFRRAKTCASRGSIIFLAFSHSVDDGAVV